jgi:hypothetical protein
MTSACRWIGASSNRGRDDVTCTGIQLSHSHGMPPMIPRRSVGLPVSATDDPDHEMILIGHFSTLAEAEAFADSMRQIDGGRSYSMGPAAGLTAAVRLSQPCSVTARAQQAPCIELRSAAWTPCGGVIISCAMRGAGGASRYSALWSGISPDYRETRARTMRARGSRTRPLCFNDFLTSRSPRRW